jgi:hypothetical protein
MGDIWPTAKDRSRDYSKNYADDQAEGPDHPHDEDIP